MRICWVLAIVTFWAGQSVQAGVENPYRMEKLDRYYKDLLKLHSGEMRTGKIVEWADEILIYDNAGTSSGVSARDVDWVQFRREAVHSDRLLLPDLTVAYVERLPRATSWHAGVTMRNGIATISDDLTSMSSRPSAGDNVTFRVHVLNAGSKISMPVSCDASIDGQRIGQPVAVPAIRPGDAFVAEFSWPWSDDAREFVVDIDEAGEHEEWLRWNNRFVEPVQGLSVVLAVPRNVYSAFLASPNLVDSYCFEDYAQYHLRCFNALLDASRYPTSPDGILERVRLDRIVIVDDEIDDVAERQKLVDSRGHAAYEAFVSMRGHPDAAADGADVESLRIDWPSLQRLGQEIGLVNTSVFDTTLSECAVYDRFGRPAIVRHVSNESPSMMRQAGPFPFSEVEAAHLNRIIGTPRGVSGSYLTQVPEQIKIEVVGTNGVPIPGVTIEVFQLVTDENGDRRVRGISGSDPWVEVETDESGRAPLPNRPWPAGATPDGYPVKANAFGPIATDGGNGLLLFRMRYGDGKRQMEAFEFLSLATCNEAFLRGQTGEFVHRIETRFPNRNAVDIPRIPFAFAQMPKRNDPHPELTVAWPVSSGIDLAKVGEYRLYRRIGFGGGNTSPWTLVSSILQPINTGAVNQSLQDYFDSDAHVATKGMDTWFAVSLADREGREGAMSEPTFLPHGKECHKLAIQDNVGYMTLSGDGPPIMLYWDAVAGSQPYMPRTNRYPGYVAHYEGVSFCNEGLVVTDPVNHVLAIYDTSRGRHELIRTIPDRAAWPGPPSFLDGEFNSPADVAADSKKRLYVADRGNHRVQILTSSGAYEGLLDPDFRFRGPHAVAFSNGRVCVTDDSGRRVRVYDVRGDSPKFVLQLPELLEADRALVTESGGVVVTARRPDSDVSALQVFQPAGQSATFVETIEDAMMGKVHSPRGLYQHEKIKHLAYFVNSFPFDVRGVMIGTPPGK